MRQSMVKLKEEQKALIDQQRQMADQRRAAAARGDSAEVQRLIKEEAKLREERRQQISAIADLKKKTDELRGTMDPLGMSLTELRARAQELRQAWAAGIGSPEQLQKIGVELQEVEMRMQALGTAQGRALMLWEQQREQIDLQRMSLEQLALEQKRWETIRDNAGGDTAQYRQADEALAKVRDRQDELTNAKRKAAEAWEKERQGMLLTDMTLEQLEKEYARAQAIRDKASSGAEYEKAQADLEAVRLRQEQLTNSKQRALEAWEKERQSIALTDMTLEQLEMEYQRAEKIRESAKPGNEYDKAQTDLLAVKERLEQMTNESRRAADQWKVLRQTMTIDQMSLEQLKLEKQYLEDLRGTLDRTTAEYADLTRRLNETEQALGASRKGTDVAEREWDKLRKTLRLTDMTMEQLEQEARRLETIIRTTDPNTAEWAAYRKELSAVEARTKTLQSGLGPFGRMWAEIKGNVMSAAAVLGGMFAGQALFTGMGNMVRAAADFSDQVSNVKRTTGLSTDAVQRLSQELSKMDTRTARSELMALAADAGKLGLSAEKDVLAFVRAGNQINVALGEELGQDAIKNIGKLVDLFSLKQTFGLEESMLKVGSTLNELGMSSTAAEGYMVEFLRRMGGIAPLAGITIDQTLALGATLDSLGQTSEVSSTALSKMFVQMASDAEQYASIAGMSTERFRDLMAKNALEAFIAVLEGSKKTEGGIIALTETLGDLGVDGSRAAGVFGVLSANTETLRKQMGIANAAFQEGTSVTKEYEEVNTNLAATLAKLGQEWNKLFANKTVVGWLEGLVAGVRDAISWLQRKKDTIIFLGKVLATAGVAWTTYRLSVALTTKATMMAAAATRGLALVKGLLTGSTIAAARAQVLLNNAMKMNPIGLVASALATLITALNSFGQEVELATEQNNNYNESLQKTREIAASMDNFRGNKAVYEKLNQEQLLAERTRLQQAIAQQEEYLAEALAKEQAHAGRLQNLYNSRASKIAEVEQKIANEKDRIQRRVLEVELITLKDSLRTEEEVRKVTGQAITSERAKANKAELEGLLKTVNQRLSIVKTAADEEVRTLAQINQQIQVLEEQREQSADAKSYADFTRKIKSLEAERDAITGAASEKRVNKQVEDWNRLEQEYRELLGRLARNGQDADGKELDELEAKHAEELRQVREHQAKLIAAKKLSPEAAQEDLQRLGKQQEAERTALITSQAERRWAAMAEWDAKIRAALRENHTAVLDMELQRVDEQIAIEERGGRMNVELQEKRKNLLIQIYQANATAALDAEKEKWTALIAEAQKRLDEYDAVLADSPLDPTDEQLETRKQLQDNLLKLKTAFQKMEAAMDAEHKAKMAAAEDAYQAALRQKRIQQLQDFATIANGFNQLVQGMIQWQQVAVDIAEKNADADGVRTQAEIENIQRLEAERRRAALVSLAVQGTAAIASGVANAFAPGTPWPVAVAQGLATVGIVLGLMAQARALINGVGSDQRNVQGVRRGSLNDAPLGAKGGVLKGSSHDQGGLGVWDNRTGEQVAELEGGEAYAVLSKRFVQANADLLPQLFQASRDGTRFTPFGRDLQLPNPNRVNQAMRVVHMADGGVIPGSRTVRGTALVNMPTEPGGGVGYEELLRINQAMLQAIQQNTEVAANWPTNLKATTSLIEGERRRTEYDYVKQLSKGRRA